MTSHALPKDGLRFAFVLPAIAAALLLIAAWASPARASDDSVKVEGTLQVAHSDDFKGKQSRFYYKLRTKRQTLKLAPQSKRVRAKLDRAGTGSRLVVRGQRTASGLKADSVAAQSSASAAVVEPSSVHKMAIVLLTFDGNQPWSNASIQSTIGIVNNFYSRQSDGRLKFAGTSGADPDIFGWYKVARGSGCDVDGWSRDARVQAEKQHGSLSSYDNVIYAFPNQSACSWAGMGTIGSSYHAQNTTWINGYMQNWSVISHELGHNVGLHHANAYNCTEGGKRVAIGSNCSSREYGDPFDVMGSGGDSFGGGGTFNAQHNGRLGSLGEFPALPTQDADASGDYSIDPMIAGTFGTQALRIKKSGSGASALYYYLQADWNNSVRVTFGNAYEGEALQTQLIDTTPTTTSFGDAALAPGKTFTDPAAKLTVSALGAGPDGATLVHVAAGSVGNPPPPPPPPPAGSAPQVTISSPSEGQTVAGTVQIKASATDDVAVKRIELYVDGQRLLRKSGGSLVRNWQVGAARYARGPHVIVVKAYDGEGGGNGNEGSATMNVVKG